MKGRIATAQPELFQETIGVDEMPEGKRPEAKVEVEKAKERDLPRHEGAQLWADLWGLVHEKWAEEYRDAQSCPREDHPFLRLKRLNDWLTDIETFFGGSTIAPRNRRIDGGRLVTTPGVLERVHPAEIHRSLGRHLSGDWGEVCDEDREANEEALREGARLFSVYRGDDGERFWIITEADRSSTCVLLPEEY